jgi:hypothetical protein
MAVYQREANMALTDDLRDYISRNSNPTTQIKERHNVAIVGESHALLTTPSSERRTRAVNRLLLELLADPKYKYFANESFEMEGVMRRSVDDYMREKKLPPSFDPRQLARLSLEQIGERVFVRRYQPVLDFIRANPRFILNIGSLMPVGDPLRDAVLAINFIVELNTRHLHLGDMGVLLVGALHATAVTDFEWTSVRMKLEKHGLKCVSIRILTNYQDPHINVPDDAVFLNTKPLADRTTDDIIRLTSFVDKTPVTIAVNRSWTNNRASPFWSFTFETSLVPVAQQFDYIVLHKDV